MKKIMFLLSIIMLFVGCEKYAKVSDAYGNFECEEVIVSSEARGILQDIKVSEGESLVQNQLIAVIDTTELALQRRELGLQLSLIEIKKAKVKSDLEVMLIDLAKVKGDVAKNRILYEVGALSLEVLENHQYKQDVLETQYAGNRLNITSLEAEKKQIGIKLEQANHEIAKCYIKSPSAGTVLTKFVQVGELVTVGKPVIKLSNLADTYLKAYVTQTQLSSITLNQAVTILIDDQAGLKELPGRISFISSKAEFTPKTIQTRDERANLVYAIKIALEYEDAVKIGMPAEVIFKSN